MSSLSDNPDCPKCGSPMRDLNLAVGFPRYIDPTLEPGYDSLMDAKNVYAANVHTCTSCSYIEFFRNE
jgi:predicted nucleic-acid-binding Zn-ribbon protein